MPTENPEVAARYTRALAAYEASRPRAMQVTLGPSELGGCREYIRNVMVGTPGAPADVWPGAAAVGTLVGEYVERRAEEAFAAVTEQDVQTTILIPPNVMDAGAQPEPFVVAGHADIVEVENNAVLDVKSKDGLEGVREEGPSLENAIQISTYTVGLVQAGILEPGATATLLYIDRSGREQEAYALTFSWDEIQEYVAELGRRLRSVLDAQAAIDETGDMEAAHNLRDKPPSYCFSEKVMCPFREACWKSPHSEWAPTAPEMQVEDPDLIALVERYADARDRQKGAKATQDALRAEIKALGLVGKQVGPYSVVLRPTSYGGEALYVTKTKTRTA